MESVNTLRSMDAATLEANLSEYQEKFKTLKDKYSSMLTKRFEGLYPSKPDLVKNIVLEKLHMMCRDKFKHELERVYVSNETDDVMVERQSDLTTCMIYGQDMYMNQHDIVVKLM